MCTCKCASACSLLHARNSCASTPYARATAVRATLALWLLVVAQRPSSAFPVQPPSENLTSDAEESHAAMVNPPCATHRQIRRRGRRRRTQRQQAPGHHERAARACSAGEHLRPPPPTVSARLVQRIISILLNAVKAACKTSETFVRMATHLARIAHSAPLSPRISHRHRRKRQPRRPHYHASSTRQASRRRRRHRQRSARRSRRRRTSARPPDRSDPGALLQQLLLCATNAAALLNPGPQHFAAATWNVCGLAAKYLSVHSLLQLPQHYTDTACDTCDCKLDAVVLTETKMRHTDQPASHAANFEPSRLRTFANCAATAATRRSSPTSAAAGGARARVGHAPASPSSSTRTLRNKPRKWTSPPTW
jgi:hypothetical protein